MGTTTTVTIDNGTQVWRLIGEDEKGLPTNIGFGSLTQQLSFDLAGRVTGRKVRYGNEPYIQNAAYEYEVATGNMMMRTDSIYGHEEAFAYDYLNRLTDNGTGGYSAPVALVRDYGSDRWLVRHILRDNQGSIVAIADTAGNPVSTINQQWNGVLKTEYAQIIKLRQSVVTTATPKAQKALQVKEAQYSSLSKASTALKSVSKATTITNF